MQNRRLLQNWIKAFPKLDDFFFSNRGWTIFIHSPLGKIFQIPVLRCIAKGTYFHLYALFRNLPCTKGVANASAAQAANNFLLC